MISHVARISLSLCVVALPIVAAAQSAPPPADPSPLASPASALPVAPPTPSTPLVELRAGTQIVVSPASTLSSATAHVGDSFIIKATTDVLSGAWVAIPKDARGEAHVTAVEPAGNSGHKGSLTIAFDWITGADGNRIPLSSVDHSASGKGQLDESRAATVAGVVLFGPVGLFTHNLVKGHEATVGTGQTFTVFVDKNVSVAATQQSTGTATREYSH